MAANSIVCDSSVIRGMSNDPRNICYHYRHHLTDKQVYHCEISYSEVVDGLMRDLKISRERADVLFSKWSDEFKSELMPLTRRGRRIATQIQKRLVSLKGLIPVRTVTENENDCIIAGETIAQGIQELAAHDRDFLFIEAVCNNELVVVILEMSPDGRPRAKKLSSQHRQRLVHSMRQQGYLDTSLAIS